MIPDKKAKLIVALDVDTLKGAKGLVDKLYPRVKIFKVGSQLFTAAGTEAIKYIRRKGADVFLDLKFYDIPNTVAMAVAAAVNLNVYMLTVHAEGGSDMLGAAARAARETSKNLKKRRPIIVAVTVLTSKASKDAGRRVLSLAKLAHQSGVDGVVASARECKNLRNNFRKKFIIVTPGIRPKGASKDDQKRVATASEAVRDGSNFLVVGRPITAARDPVMAAREILREINSGK